MTATAIDRVCTCLAELRCPVQKTEAQLHETIASHLMHAGVPFIHEARLAAGMRIDFLCDGGVGIEVKKGKPNVAQVEHQIGRYLGCEDVSGIVLVVERNVFRSLRVAGDKPVRVMSLIRNWGVAL